MLSNIVFFLLLFTSRWTVTWNLTTQYVKLSCARRQPLFLSASVCQPGLYSEHVKSSLAPSTNSLHPLKNTLSQTCQSDKHCRPWQINFSPVWWKRKKLSPSHTVLRSCTPIGKCKHGYIKYLKDSETQSSSDTVSVQTQNIKSDPLETLLELRWLYQKVIWQYISLTAQNCGQTKATTTRKL